MADEATEMSDYDILKQAGFSDEEILADAGFSPEEIAQAVSVPTGTPMERGAALNDYQFPPSTDIGGAPVSLFDSPGGVVQDSFIQNPPLLRTPEEIAATVQKDIPPILETGANIAGTVGGLAITKDPVRAGALGAVAEQGMSHLLQALGAKPELSPTEDLINAGVSTTLNAGIPLVGKGLRYPFAAKTNRALAEDELGRLLFQPRGETQVGRSYAQQLKDAKKFIVDSEFLKGGTRFDAATGKFLGGVKAPKDLQSLRANVDAVLGDGINTGLIAERNKVMSNIDDAITTFNLNSKRTNQISGFTEVDVRSALNPLSKQAGNLKKTPSITGDMGDVIQATVDGLVEDVWSQPGHIAKTITIADAQGARRVVTDKSLSVVQLNDMISNLYEAQRNLGRFKAKALDPAQLQVAEVTAKSYAQAAFNLRKLRDSKIAEVFNKVGKSGLLKGLDENRVANLNSAIHNLSAFRDAGLDPALNIISRVGARSALTSEAEDVALPTFNRKPLGWFSSSINKGRDFLGRGPETISDRVSTSAAARLANMQRLNEMALSGEVSRTARVGEALDSPFGAFLGAAANYHRKDGPESAFADVLAAQGLQHGIEAPAPQPIQLPRSVAGIDLNQMQYKLTLDLLAEQGVISDEQAAFGVDVNSLPPDLVGEATQIAGGIVSRMENVLKFGTEEDQQAEYGAIVKQFPDAFPPSKTGIPGEIEIGGKPALPLPEDKLFYGNRVKESSLSELEKARVLDELHRTGKVVKIIR